MGKKLYIGNLPFSADEAALKEVFSQVGQVESTTIVMDKFTSRSKGFGFVEMSTDEEAQAAIAKFNGGDFNGRAISVAEAKPFVPRSGAQAGPRPERK